MNKLRIDVWSDIACPWCYVGKRHLEAALARFPQRDSVEVVWRAFELDSAAPRVRPTEVSYSERLAKKYGTSTEKAEAMISRMVDVAAADGLDFRFDHIKPGNTFDAHRLIHFAHQRGVQDAMKERLLRAYMTEGEAVGEPAVLERLAVEVGLDGNAVHAMLKSDECAAAVRADEAEARQLGISGVPFFVLGGHYALSGAQPAEVMLQALTQAWAELAPHAPGDTSFPEGATCGPDGCA
jgi:predicted DsbA family dithiol-disulfide isomerase